jgi:hypothetical protein
MWQEIREALGNDRDRIDPAYVRPLVVEHLLHRCFDNDAHLHAAVRTRADAMRTALLAQNPDPVRDGAAWESFAGEHGAVMSEFRCYLLPKPGDVNAIHEAATHPASPGDTVTGGPYSVEAVVELDPAKAKEAIVKELYLEDMPPDLARLLTVQLRESGNVSALVETDHGFNVYVTTERTATHLSARLFHFAKLGYEEWISREERRE